jgi:transposase-like protein
MSKRKKHEISEEVGCVNPECEFFNKPGSVCNIGQVKNSGKNTFYLCRKCGKKFSETYGTIFANKQIAPDKIVQVLKSLAEGTSIRGAARIFGHTKDTVCSWLKEAGEHCEVVEKMLVNEFQFNQVQVDELWTFILKKTTHPVKGKVGSLK